jgi:hypothetical protein
MFLENLGLTLTDARPPAIPLMVRLRRSVGGCQFAKYFFLHSRNSSNPLEFVKLLVPRFSQVQ